MWQHQSPRVALPSEAVSAFFFFEMSFLSLEVQLAYHVLPFQILFCNFRESKVFWRWHHCG